MPLPKKNEHYTYQDYVTWPDDERWELIDGVPYNMTPSPRFEHQRIVVRFAAILERVLEGKPCTTCVAPMDVIFSEIDVVQPDFFVVCDRSKIIDGRMKGVPDMIVEVLSPSTSTRDLREKKRLYERFGVKEYILADPERKNVQQFVLEEDGRYDRGEVFDDKQTIVLNSLPGIEIDLGSVFETNRELPAQSEG